MVVVIVCIVLVGDRIASRQNSILCYLQRIRMPIRILFDSRERREHAAKDIIAVRNPFQRLEEPIRYSNAMPYDVSGWGNHLRSMRIRIGCTLTFFTVITCPHGNQRMWST